MMKKQIRLISIIILIFVFVYGMAEKNSPEGGNAKENLIRVEHVNDGDTITAIVDSRREKIRLIGIDTPEMGQRPWGQKAKEHLENLIAFSSWQVIIEYDIEKRDKYNRFLAYIWTKDGRMVNKEMLKSGYALLFTFPPNVKHVEEFMSAQSEAREKRIGIWSKNGLKQRPYDYRKEHPRKN